MTINGLVIFPSPRRTQDIKRTDTRLVNNGSSVVVILHAFIKYTYNSTAQNRVELLVVNEILNKMRV